MIIEGTFELEICSEMVPDLETAKIEFDKICDLIFSSDTTSILFKSVFLTWLIINSLFSSVACKTKASFRSNDGHRYSLCCGFPIEYVLGTKGFVCRPSRFFGLWSSWWNRWKHVNNKGRNLGAEQQKIVVFLPNARNHFDPRLRFTIHATHCA